MMAGLFGRLRHGPDERDETCSQVQERRRCKLAAYQPATTVGQFKGKNDQGTGSNCLPPKGGSAKQRLPVIAHCGDDGAGIDLISDPVFAVFADQPKISHRIPKRPDFAVLIRIDCPNRHKTKPKSLARSQNDTLALKLEAVAGRHQNREQFFARKPESALAIGNQEFYRFAQSART